MDLHPLYPIAEAIDKYILVNNSTPEYVICSDDLYEHMVNKFNCAKVYGVEISRFSDNGKIFFKDVQFILMESEHWLLEDIE